MKERAVQTILIIEDDPVIRQELKTLLEKYRYHVVAAFLFPVLFWVGGFPACRSNTSSSAAIIGLFRLSRSSWIKNTCWLKSSRGRISMQAPSSAPL
jgi:hypothetical protein